MRIISASIYQNRAKRILAIYAKNRLRMSSRRTEWVI